MVELDRPAQPFGELIIVRGGGADAETVILGPGANPWLREVPGDPAALFALRRTDDAGAYRPLTGARSLARNWHIRIADLVALREAVEAIYPLAPRHRRQWREGRLRIVRQEAVFVRQAGRYQVAATLSEGGREAARVVLCGDCVRTPFWCLETIPPPDGAGGVPRTAIPCPEPCSVFLALCRELALAERGEPAPPCATSTDSAIPFAAFEEAHNPIRLACLARMEVPGGER
jgi:hypothetical protein